MGGEANTTDAGGGVRYTEKRLVGRALTHWETLRGGREFPCLEDFQVSAIPHDDVNVFVIRVGADEYSDHIVRADGAIGNALGRDPVGMRAIDVLPSSTEMGLSFCRAAAQMKKPIADVGSFTNTRGQEVRYRCILLPLSEDQDSINYVLGAFSFRIME